MPTSSENSRSFDERELLLLRELRRRQTDPRRHSLLEFARHVWPDYSAGQFHRTLCSYLDRVQSGQIKRLMVFAPPQHGKSQAVSRLMPAQALGLDPSTRVLACSYAHSLASAMNRDVQRIMADPAYREVFGSTRLARSRRGSDDETALRNSSEFDVLDGAGRVRGKYRSAGAGAGIVGKSADLIVIDDPVASAEQAYSPTYRDRLWDWYNAEVVTRQSPTCRIVLMHQRWHEDDLAGRLLKQATDNPRADQWTVVRFPARAYPAGHPLRCPEDTRAEGEPLWPERYGDEFLAAREAGMSVFQFAAIYQQNPQPLAGAHFRAEWLARTWRDVGGAWKLDGSRTIMPDRCQIVAVCDPAASEKQTADHTAIGIFALTPAGELLVLEMVRGRWPIGSAEDDPSPDIVKVLLATCQRWRVQAILFEATGFQVGIVREARRTKGMPPVREVSPASRSKLVRATEAIHRCATGQVYLPESAPWVPGFVDELVRFDGRDGGQDDQVDCLAYAALMQSRKLDESARSQFAPYVAGK